MFKRLDHSWKLGPSFCQGHPPPARPSFRLESQPAAGRKDVLKNTFHGTMLSPRVNFLKAEEGRRHEDSRCVWGPLLPALRQDGTRSWTLAPGEGKAWATRQQELPPQTRRLWASGIFLRTQTTSPFSRVNQATPQVKAGAWCTAQALAAFSLAQPTYLCQLLARLA